MCLGFIRRTGLPEQKVFDLFNNVLQIPSLAGKDWNITSAHVVEAVMKKTYEVLGDVNPLKREKAKLNRSLMDRYETFERMVRDSSDPLETAVKLAILGNAIDVMISLDFSTLVKFVREKMAQSISEKRFGAFSAQLEKTRHLLYFGDNAGEIVLDKLLISFLKEMFEMDITYVVRSQATLNDVTLEEARQIHMDDVVPVLENGIDGPFPGTEVSRCSPEVQDLYMKADLVISKGGGNFDSLEEDKALYGRNISFLLLSKCYLYMTLLKTPLDAPILANYHNSVDLW